MPDILLCAIPKSKCCNQGIPRNFDVTSKDGYWSVEAYIAVLNALLPNGYGNRPGERYYPSNGFTWCNIFVWDATAAMGVEIPHYYNAITGKEIDISNFDYSNPNHFEMADFRVYSWLEEFGGANDWNEVSAKDAQAFADLGHPVIATVPSHCAMVLPSDGSHMMMVAQAGGDSAGFFNSSTPVFATNKIALSWAFYSYQGDVRYYAHS